MRFYDDLNFKKSKKIFMEIVAGEQGLAFSISGVLKVAAHNFMKSRSRDGLAAQGLLIRIPWACLSSLF